MPQAVPRLISNWPSPFTSRKARLFFDTAPSKGGDCQMSVPVMGSTICNSEGVPGLMAPSPAVATIRFLRVYEDSSRYIEVACGIGYECSSFRVLSSCYNGGTEGYEPEPAST